MTENDLLKLGFIKEMPDAEILGEPDFYYYVKDICKGLTFISNSNDKSRRQNRSLAFF